MADEPTNCAACGRPTQSHPVTIDIRDVDMIGLPTLAGVVCHRCWTGDSHDPAIESLVGDNDRLREELDTRRLVAIDTPVEDYDGG